MRVSIVCPLLAEKERILARLASTLAEGNGWRLGTEPDLKVDVNYWFPYLAYRRVPTLSAAWFTHVDEAVSAKVGVWRDAAAGVGLRLASARIYLPQLEGHGPTTIVTPPLDRARFCPGQQTSHNPRVVGTTGYCYDTGRKGQDLLAALTHSREGEHCEWRATGRGWPVPTKGLRFDEMAEFYRGLDVYVCTSSVEGIGYGPLEALSCGIRTIVPRGVGIFDELGEAPGLYRYDRGSLPGLRAALAAALAGEYDPSALRALTERFTVEAWCRDHREAFERLGSDAPIPSLSRGEPSVSAPSSSPAPGGLAATTGSRGLFVVAFGEPSRQAASRCIPSFKKHMPGVAVALCSDRALGPEDVLIQQPEADIGARSQKVRIYDLAPAQWEQVLYLDADTEVVAPIGPLFDWLSDGWELCICKNPGKFALASNMGRADNTDECQRTFDLWGTDQLLQLQGGVFSFRRCEATRELFAAWHAEWQRWGKRDQGALLRAYWQHPVRTMILGNEWNLVGAYDGKEQCAGVMHYPMTARRWEGIVHERSDSPQAWERVRQWERTHREAVAR